MCGRYVSPEQAAIERQWHIGRQNKPPLFEPFAARYNVAPQQGNPAKYIPVIRHAEGGEPELVRLQWWLLPFWSKEPRIKYSTFNARVSSMTVTGHQETLTRQGNRSRGRPVNTRKPPSRITARKISSESKSIVLILRKIRRTNSFVQKVIE